jgi:uncharacterized protein (DUF433 family)
MEVTRDVAPSRAKMSHMDEQGGDELIGVSRSTAARVIDINERRLRAWNDRGLVSPSLVTELGSRSMWTFSLEDLVQGRVVKELEERGISVRHIRRVVEAVRSSTHPHPLASLVWGVAGNEIFVGYPDGSWVGDRRPHQHVFIETLDLETIRGDARRAAQERQPENVGAVESRRGKLGSKDVFAGTRIPVSAVVEYIERGASDERILQGFPDLRSEDIDAARRLVS